MKKLFGFTVMLLCGIGVAKGSDVLSIRNFKAPRGGNAVLSVNLENEQDITAFSFDLYLPEGVTVSGQSLTDRKAESHSLSANLVEGVWKFGCFSGASAPFSDNEGSVCDISLKINKKVALGDLTVQIKNIEISTPSAQKLNPSDISCTMNIIDYEDGYSVSMLPFAFTEDVDGLEFVLSTQKALTNIEFDITFPDAVGTNQLYSVAKSLGNTTATTSIDDDENGFVTVSIARKSTKTIADGTTVAKLEIGYDGEVLESGVLSLSINNIFLTDVDGVKHFAAPTSTSIFVGASPKMVPEEGVVTFAGDYSDSDMFSLLANAIPESGFENLDLTKVTALPAGTKFTVPANAMIWTSADLGLDQKNVIVNGVCDNLELADGSPMRVLDDFTATNASYTRPMAQTGIYSLYLPFAISAPTGAKLLVFDRFQDSKLYFNEVDQVDAYTPCLVNFNGTTQFQATQAGAAVKTESVQSGKFVGTLTEIAAPYAQGYYTLFADGSGFGTATNNASIPAFRSYYRNESSSVVSFLGIVIDNGTTQVEIPVEKLSSSDVYSISGLMMNGREMNRGIFISNGKKYIVE